MEVGEGEDGGKKRLPDKSSKPTEPTSPPDEVMATRGQDQESTTSISARSAPRDHPDNAGTRNPIRPSEDPGDVMGDNKRHPDAPTEPPDKPLDKEVEGARVEGLEVEMAVAEASRGIQECPDEDGCDERRPGMADEPPDKAQVKPRDRADVEVEPGGKTIAGRNGDVVHECADTAANVRAEEAHGVMQVEGERGST